MIQQLVAMRERLRVAAELIVSRTTRV